MKRSLPTIWLTLFALSLAAPTAGGAPPASAPGGLPAASYRDVTLLRSDEDGLVFELTLPAPAVTAVAGTGGHVVRMAGYPPLAEPGRPALPARGWLIGLPPGARASVRATVLESQSFSGVDVLPAARASRGLPDPRANGLPVFPPAVPDISRDPAVYGRDAFWPAASASVGAPARLRDLNTQVVTVYPVQANPLRGELRAARRLRVDVAFAYAQGRPRPRPRAESAVWLGQMAASVLNWEQAQEWLDAPEPTPAAGALTGDLFRIRVARDGLTSLSYAALQAAGFPSGITTTALYLRDSGGTELAIRVLDTNASGQFDGEDQVLFWGQGLAGNRYTRSNVYWLGYDSSAGLRMATVNAPPGTGSAPQAYTHTLRFEQNRLYRGYTPLSDATDHWYWTWLYAGGLNEALTLPVTLTNYAAIPGTYVTVRLTLVGYEGETNNHVVSVRWNGYSAVASCLTWFGDGPVTCSVRIPASAAVGGTNTLVVRAELAAGLSHYVFIDKLTVDYRHRYQADGDLALFSPDASGTWRYAVGGFRQGGAMLEAYDVGNPAVVRMINGVPSGAGGIYTYTFELESSPANRFLVQTSANRLAPQSIERDTPSTLRSDTAQTDYVLIVADALAPSVAPLVSLRQAEGYTVRVVRVQDVYDEFAGGVATASAIKDFLTWAYSGGWRPPAPSFVLLFGDGTFDPQGNCLAPGSCPGITGQPTLVPAYLTAVDPNMGETAADHCYVVGSAPCGYGYPHTLALMHLGRVPARDAAEAAAAVDKLVAYASPPPGAWRSFALNLCDNGIDENGYTDPAGNFYTLCANYAASIRPYLWSVECAYYANNLAFRNQPCYYYSAFGDPPDPFTDKWVNAVNSGAVMATYTGHGNSLYLAGERLLELSDVDRLTNADRPVWWYPMTCLEGYYVFPSLSSVAEKMLLATNGGSIGSFSPTGLDVATAHELLRDGMTEATFLDGERELGVLTDAGKLYLWQQPGWEPYRHLLATYMLIGDPAASLAIQPLTGSLYSVNLPMATR